MTDFGRMTEIIPGDDPPGPTPKARWRAADTSSGAPFRPPPYLAFVRMTLWSSGGVMVECESSGRDKMAVPRSSDAEPADASRLLAHSRLLDSVAAFTHHRD